MISATLGCRSRYSHSSAESAAQPGGGCGRRSSASAASQPVTAVTLAREKEFARSHQIDV
jgi:hypothetical protein